MKKTGKKVTSNVVSTKPLEGVGSQVIESARVGGVGNKTAPVDYSKKGK